MNLHVNGLGMGKIAEKLDRSPASIKKHVDMHNEAVQRQGFCVRCKRVGSNLYREGEA